MAFRVVTDLSADVTISLGGINKKTGKKNPTSIEGYYLGNRRVDDRKKKSGFSFIYVFQTAQGNVGVWGKTDMDRKMGEAVTGQMTRVSFDRMVPTPNGDMYKYKVEVDDENTIEVVGSPSGNNLGSSNDYDDADLTAEAVGGFNTSRATDVAGYLEDDTDEDELQAKALAQAEAQARTQAFLNKGKNKTKSA